ncbi:hypothetical protein THAR02_09923 [Trichoderma harzianum]|uniref:Zn(2)-C6 fungal-type domain-containing protein n=1 Tax=Trichoderma harzianum TaxID=5544 RepID=A0A0F9WZV9_TRIHA|nr:hypothetical protein THAR02_09923 [Trichoderma harzianum]
MAPGALTVDDTPMDAASDHESREEPISKASCEMCRRRKVKCDRMRPACGWCSRNSRVCVYKEKRKIIEESERNDQFEVRLGHLDALVQGLRQRVDSHISQHDAHHDTSPSLMSKSPSTHHDRHHSWHATASPESTRSDMLSEGARPPKVILDRPFNPTGGVKIPRSFTTNMKTVYEQEIILSMDPDLPPSDLLYVLVDLFFKHINTWFPLLDRKATFGTYFGSTSISRGDRVVLFAIIATTLRFATDARLTPGAKQKLHNDCKQKIELYALENVNLFSLKALTLLTLDVFGTSKELQGQTFLSLLVQYITHLGLYEGRRRLCWMVYVLDRYATLATPYKFILAEEDMKRFLPCRYDLWSNDIPVETRWPNGLDTTKLRLTVNTPENLGSFSYHCEVLGILSRVHNFLAKPLDIYSPQDVRSWQSTFVALEGELSTWLRDLPAEYGQISILCHSDPGARIINWIMLHAAFVISSIRLNSAAAYPVVQTDVFVPSYSAIQTCLSAVKSLRSIVQDVIETTGLSLLGPHFAFSLWTSARLLLVHAATMRCEIDSNVDFFVDTLAEMGRYWETAAKYSAILGRVTEEGRQGDKTLTEMRQRAHELSVLSDSTRLNALQPTSTRISSANELDYLEIFDFFNYPRSADHGSTAPVSEAPRFDMPVPLGTSGNFPRLGFLENMEMVRLAGNGGSDDTHQFMSRQPAWQPGAQLPWEEADDISRHKTAVYFTTRAYGGHVYIQAPLAAVKVVESEDETARGHQIRANLTIQGVFTNLGHVDRPFIYQVSKLAAGRSFQTYLVTARQPKQPSSNPCGPFPESDSKLPLGPICFSCHVTFKRPVPSFADLQLSSAQERFASILAQRKPDEWPTSPQLDIDILNDTFPNAGHGGFPIVDMYKVDMKAYNTNKPIPERRELLLYKLHKPIPAEDTNSHILVHAFEADRNGLLTISNYLGWGYNLGVAASLTYTFTVHVNSEEAVMRDGWWIQEVCWPRISAGRATLESRIWSPEGKHVASGYQDGIAGPDKKRRAEKL